MFSFSTAHSTDSSSWRQDGGLARRLLQAVDLGLAGVILVAPLFLGGRHPIGRLAFVTLISFTALCWAARQAILPHARWRHTAAQWLLAAGAILVMLQIAPLPAGVLSFASPGIEKNLPLWNAESDSAAPLGEWRQVSLAPAATRDGLALFVSYGLLFLVVVQRVQTRRDIERLLKLVALSAVGMALLGLAQYLLSNGKFLWVYAHPSRDTHTEVRAAFDNENHFAHFLALGVGPLIWWLLSVWKKSGDSRSFGSNRPGVERGQAARVSLMLALLLVAVAGAMSFSRGGVAAIVLAAIGALALLAKTRLLGWQAFAALAATAALAAAALWVHGYQQLAQEMSTVAAVADGSLDTLDRAGSRRHLWSADLDAVSDYWLLGSGVGTHEEVYPTYYEEPSSVEYEYAESGYLQVLVTAGAAGLFLVAIGVGLCLWWAAGVFRQRPSREAAACGAALCAGLLVSVAHSVVDFVWFIPACIATTSILAACLCRLSQLVAIEGAESQNSREKKTTPSGGGKTWLAPRPVWLAVCATLLAACGLIVYGRLGPAQAASHWNQFYALNLAASGPDDDGKRGLSASFGEVNRLDPTTVQTLASHLEKTLAADEENARAHLRLASVCIRQFEIAQIDSENAMALSQIRDAALASQFPTHEAQDEWLTRAIGDNRRLLDAALAHAHRAAQLCPLQGRAYVYLSQLAFLEGPEQERKRAYVDQALLVRPHAGEVLIAAGAEAIFEGRQDEAMAYWKKAFHQGVSFQHQIMEIVALTAPAEFAFEQFQPDMPAALLISEHYEQVGQTDQAAFAVARYASLVEKEAQLVSPEKAANLWQKAATIYTRLEAWPQALSCAERAAKLDSQDFDRRLTYARLLLQEERFGEAVDEFQWCLTRKPGDKNLQAAHNRAQQGLYRRASNIAPADYNEPLR